ncbi:PREDICTED: WEB family protein At3g02930, chloroplastic-like isoform X4 [Brassica oleracea var. oleracea]|uniref:WEB family protein At3g02930, chloroplastic-like isoform X4 n=1 Tax=Brassica oleracea var. oleracea TaxID=109376 RepID=UPI0006A6A3EA|nr:PREDICTED: WEB family protein At3g02930, chloroplastic-like isoform X4 [Brassica oleracea var. oleracea]XP_013617603.1 PREDICTED: WEB family protein At3g02930, chloroplastic-like isoform X4 [Brassica oleracea var. oleracea]
MDPKIKIKTGLSETTLRALRKSSPGSLGVPKLSRIMTKSEPNSPSPTRLSLDRSPANRSRKAPTPPEVSLSMKTRTRSVNGSSESSQPRSIQLKEDLRKANELIASLENELEQVREESLEKLYEALESQKTAKESFEIEKFKAVEAGVEAFHLKEEELKKELEIVRNQHASDSAVLLLVTRELEKVSLELAKADDAKNMLLSQADDATKRAAILKSELENARCFKAEVKKRDKIIEKLDGEIEVLKMDKSYADGSADQWCNKTIVLERQLEEANTMKRTASASLASLTKQLEGSNKKLRAVESEVADLKDKAKLMATVGLRQSQDLERSGHMLEAVEELLSKVEKEAMKLKSEVETVTEEKKESLKREQMLLEEKSRISSELERSKEKLLSLGGRDYETQVEHYKKMLDEAKLEIDVLVSALEQTKMREAGLVNHVKKFEEEVCSMGKEINRLGCLVKRTKEEADGALKKESEMRDELKEVEDEVIYLQETLREARGESLKLNAKMLDKETEFQSVIHENDLLVKKIKELEEALAKKDSELSDSEQDYDLVETLDGMNVKLEEKREVKEDSSDGNDDDDAVEVEYSMWESYHTGKKEGFHKGK